MRFPDVRPTDRACICGVLPHRAFDQLLSADLLCPSCATAASILGLGT